MSEHHDHSLSSAGKQRQNRHPKKDRRKALLWTSLLGMVGWVLLVIVMFDDLNRTDRPGRGQRFPEPEAATEEGPPVIKLRDLEALGFSDSLRTHIEPHIHVLNAALVTLVELHAQFAAESHAEHREAIKQRAGTFHRTADMHEEEIEAELPEHLKAQFHAYMRRMESLAGLPDDEQWHLHRSEQHLSPAPHLHRDSLHIREDTA